MARRTAVEAKLPRLTKVKAAGLLIATVAMVVTSVVDIAGLAPPGRRMLGIFLAAIALWVTEAIPLYATAVGVILAQVLLISTDGLVDAGPDAPTSTAIFATLASPVLILFLGGFLLADGAAKFGLDRSIAAVMLRPFHGSARGTVFGLMLITGLLSMFMSNTATTATMFAVVLPILALVPEEKMRAGVAVSIPVAANIGGIGTPVGSPPNAVALGALKERGVDLTFVDWMALALPYTLALLFFAWWVICLWFVPRGGKLTVTMSASFDTSIPARVFYVVAGVTILLWMSEPLHGLSSNIVGFIPVVALLGTQVMSGEDLKKLSWPVLWLVAGGIALGKGAQATGLDGWIVGAVQWSSLPVWALLLGLAALGLGMSNVMSHSASANLLVPLALGFSAGLAVSPITIAVLIAIACSLGMSMPISTPPNAIAYATGAIKTKDMAVVGLVVGGIGALVLAFALPWLWDLSGITS
ncbi:SLC13 family permease [Buchananella hordeovulneris]|uniref:Transporter n=1 Tax=Buchananella hordeovulneris TaxID=52770 RepID=A0A1Q5PVY6_9ACTO|nr:DASS family sodium-coupled anion symporter [Buchananella hordeovulneris]MDO5081479.1 DASS family sodium-coupled anion symporter [Buchananella hordeovulneris]OKL51585.1 transporter [Buchananella hordeovulneris]